MQLWRGLGKYLTAGMELGSPQIVFPARGREYEAVNVRITVNNTAPTDPGLPRVVFIGVGLQANQSGLKGRLRKQMVPKAPSAPPQSRSRIHAVTDGEDAAQITPSERRLGDVLLPGQSVVYEVDVPAKDVPYLELSLEGTVSRRHFLSYRKTLDMPLAYTRPPLLAALRAFNAADIHRSLANVVVSMPELGPDLRLREVKALGGVLTETIPEIGVTQTHLGKLSRETRIPAMRTHITAAQEYLTRVLEAVTRMRDAVSSGDPGEIQNAGVVVLELRTEAAVINTATEDLMGVNGITPEETDYAYGDTVGSG